jgi:hypothetical protein
LKLILSLVAILSTSYTVFAQITGPLTSEFNSIRQNGVSSIAASGDTVWISPALNRNVGNAPEWFRPEGLDVIDNGEARVFSLDINGKNIIAGLGFSAETTAGTQPAGFGYYLSKDGGESWIFSPFYLDRFVEGDTTFVYGGTEYTRKRIIVPEQSPPYSVASKGDIIFSANWASGLLRSSDFGETWNYVYLPPFGVRELTPEQNDYVWFDCIKVENGVCIESANIYNSVDDDNLKGFAVHIDSQERVWFGSAGGINISDNALTAPIDSIRWKNVNFDNSANGLLSRWIIEIQEDTSNGRIWMTNWLAESTGSPFQGLDQFGIVYTEDGGDSFEQRLIGEKILGITFNDGHVFATGENGLFISPDGGDNWIKSPQIKSANTFLKSTTEFQAAATTTDRVWITTTDGIISTADNGQSWEITRVNFPLEGGNTYNENARAVESYAYPNPYSPNQHEVVRIRFNNNSPGNTRVRIFDFGMNLVRELEGIQANNGNYEAVWNGIDDYGRKVANGPYFYVIETSEETIKGKLLLIE